MRAIEFSIDGDPQGLFKIKIILEQKSIGKGIAGAVTTEVQNLGASAPERRATGIEAPARPGVPGAMFQGARITFCKMLPLVGWRVRALRQRAPIDTGVRSGGLRRLPLLASRWPSGDERSHHREDE